MAASSYEAPLPPGSFHGDFAYGTYRSNFNSGPGFPEYGYPADTVWPAMEQGVCLAGQRDTGSPHWDGHPARDPNTGVRAGVGMVMSWPGSDPIHPSKWQSVLGWADAVSSIAVWLKA